FVLILMVTYYHSTENNSTEPKLKHAQLKSNYSQEKHKVKKGDTLFSLSLKYAVHIEDIRKINSFSPDHTLIHPDQILLIPEQNLKPEKGVASWYGPGFHGKKMANGKIYNQNNSKVVAHRELPLGTKVLIINLDNLKTAVAKVEDRGPYVEEDGEYTRDIDCSKALAKKLGFLKAGLANVRVIPLS
ncbi:septal ring lytic transglycosylase RlpA family protein, partial [Patescibacteria group bacterium]|nr:septal ring lytic transglycosylase RlpA family protein [Patescibacteria group bacterium]